MRFDPRAVLSGLAACLVLSGGVACTSAGNGLSPSCNALYNCCGSMPNDPNITGCQETATSGGDSDAGCAAELAVYQQQGECRSGGVDSGGVVIAPGGDAGKD